MRVTVNDDEIHVDGGTSLAALLARLGFGEKGIAVAVNSAVVPRSGWEDAAVPDGARIEVVAAVQGG